VFCVAFSPDGTTFASGGADGTARIWDTATRRQIAQFAGHPSWVYAIAYSPDGTTLATASFGRVSQWSLATGEPTSRFFVGRGTNPANDAGPFAGPDPVKHPIPVYAVAYSPDGTVLAAGCDDGTVHLIDVVTGVEAFRLTGSYSIATGGSHSIEAVAFSADGTTLASSDGLTVSRWNVGSWQKTTPTVTPGPGGGADTIAFSPDGGVLAAAGRSGYLLGPGPAAEITLLPTDPDREVTAVAYLPQRGATLVTGDSAGDVSLVDTSSGRQIARLSGHAGPVRALACGPDGSLLASVAEDRTIRLWDVQAAEQVAVLTGHSDPVIAVAYAIPGGGTAAGTGFGAARPRRPLAGVRSDSPSEQDLLGIGGDVETLAELIAATETRPPLAIALIGDWGAGKSSVMLQVERQIDLLAERARNNPGLSAFAENVRQVRFNAWHYSDDQLWAGLISHLFEVLAAPADPVADAGAPDQRPVAADRQSVAAERDRLRAELAARQAASDKLTADLKTADDLRQPVGAQPVGAQPGGVPARVGAGEAATVELRPLGLQVSPVEVEFMARLGGLVRTPRAAKRLVNIYRLVRIGIPDGELARFTASGGAFRAVQVLLALLVGHPEFAREVFRAVLEGTHGEDLLAVVEEVEGGGGDTHSFGMITDFLAEIGAETGVTVGIDECRRWCPRLARFSFYTRELVTGASRELSPRGCLLVPCGRGPGPGYAGGAR
jgi:WD40 repeat protein